MIYFSKPISTTEKEAVTMLTDKLDITICGDIESIEKGLSYLYDDLSITVSTSGGYPIKVIHSELPTLEINANESGAEIVFCEKCQFFRAMGLLLEHLRDGEKIIRIKETPRFKMNGAMIDIAQSCSAVKDPRYLIRKMAIMGLNMFMFSWEDGYPVDNEPYFGYMRPKYTEDELRVFDDYAFDLGIEIIPCIQTLAHLTDPLKNAIYGGIKEDKHCLLVGAPRTYELIRNLLVSASRPFRSRRIHLGMDEAMGLGYGTHAKKHGFIPPHILMLEHLNKVMEIVRELGLEAMMWGDMFFRSVSSALGYEGYSSVVQLPKEVSDNCPKDVAIIYYEYNHKDESIHDAMIRAHSELGSHTVYAGGSWAWMSFAYRYDWTKRSMDAALSACKKYGVDEVFCTTWGDDRNEAPILVNLPSFQLFAEHGYRDDISDEYLAKRFKACTGGELSDFMLLGKLDFTPGIKNDSEITKNVSSGVLWQDIMTGLLDKNFEGLPLEAHYADLAESLIPAKSRGIEELDEMFALYCDVVDLLKIKAEAGIKLTHAYRDGDRATLEYFAYERLPDIKKAMEKLRFSHRRYFFSQNKPLGWDVWDFRYGGIINRTETAIYELREYLDGKLDRLEELDVERLPFDAKDGVPYYMWHTKIMSPTTKILT